MVVVIRLSLTIRHYSSSKKILGEKNRFKWAYALYCLPNSDVKTYNLCPDVPLRIFYFLKDSVNSQ